MTFDRALEKAMRYCSHQERCILDLEKRFYDWNLPKNEWERVLNNLIKDDYLNQNRFIKAFVRGKFIIKKWGKNKIIVGLIAKGVYQEKLFNVVFNSEIGEEDYFKTINELIHKKNQLINETDKLKKRDKLYRYMLNKGFESDLIVNALNFI